MSQLSNFLFIVTLYILIGFCFSLTYSRILFLFNIFLSTLQLSLSFRIWAAGSERHVYRRPVRRIFVLSGCVRQLPHSMHSKICISTNLQDYSLRCSMLSLPIHSQAIRASRASSSSRCRSRSSCQLPPLPTAPPPVRRASPRPSHSTRVPRAPPLRRSSAQPRPL